MNQVDNPVLLWSVCVLLCLVFGFGDCALTDASEPWSPSILHAMFSSPMSRFSVSSTPPPAAAVTQPPTAPPTPAPAPPAGDAITLLMNEIAILKSKYADIAGQVTGLTDRLDNVTSSYLEQKHLALSLNETVTTLQSEINALASQAIVLAGQAQLPQLAINSIILEQQLGFTALQEAINLYLEVWSFSFRGLGC